MERNDKINMSLDDIIRMDGMTNAAETECNGDLDISTDRLSLVPINGINNHTSEHHQPNPRFKRSNTFRGNFYVRRYYQPQNYPTRHYYQHSRPRFNADSSLEDEVHRSRNQLHRNFRNHKRRGNYGHNAFRNAMINMDESLYSPRQRGMLTEQALASFNSYGRGRREGSVFSNKSYGSNKSFGSNRSFHSSRSYHSNRSNFSYRSNRSNNSNRSNYSYRSGGWNYRRYNKRYMLDRSIQEKMRNVVSEQKAKIKDEEDNLKRDGVEELIVKPVHTQQSLHERFMSLYNDNFFG